jgi:hypothetical protein
MKIKAVSTVNLWLKAHRIDKPPATIHSAHWVTDESEYQSLIARAVIASAIVDTACNHNITISIAPSIISKVQNTPLQNPFIRGKSY